MDAKGSPSPTPMFHNCPQPTGRNVGGLGVMMRQHVLNSRRRPNKFGVGIGKEHRESRKKVDASVCIRSPNGGTRTGCRPKREVDDDGSELARGSRGRNRAGPRRPGAR
jgi:hypothetical protein